jgi:hypothetical protein
MVPEDVDGGDDDELVEKVIMGKGALPTTPHDSQQSSKPKEHEQTGRLCGRSERVE